MGIADYVVLLLVALCVLLAFYIKNRRKKSGKSGCGCGCSGNCSACKTSPVQNEEQLDKEEKENE